MSWLVPYEHEYDGEQTEDIVWVAEYEHDDDEEYWFDPGEEISSTEEFRLVKINSAGAAWYYNTACLTCDNEHIGGANVCFDAWSAYGEDDELYCSECWLESEPALVPCEQCLGTEVDGQEGVARNANASGDFECDWCRDERIEALDCATCGVQAAQDYCMSGGVRYCVPCSIRGEDVATPYKRARPTEGAAVGNTERNEKNMALLREWYPDYCPYHLYFQHVRNTRACGYGGADKCAKGSHAAPPGLEARKVDLDLGIEH